MPTVTDLMIRLFCCPYCDGYGGTIEDMCDDGMGGPTYECGFCRGKGWTISPFMRRMAREAK